MALCGFGQTYTIATFAGGGVPSANTPPSLLAVGSVTAVAVDGAGNLFMALPYYPMVMELNAATGALTAVAGTGTSGYGGDGGPATSAQLGNPTGIAVDSAGAVYIADTAFHVVRKVSGGFIATVAGTGTAGFGGDNGPAVSAQLNAPAGVAVDASFNLFISDGENRRIRKVSNGIITTIAGNGTQGVASNGSAASAAFCSPRGLAVDAAGSIYVADSCNGVVRKISGGTIVTVAGDEFGNYGILGDGGPATSASLQDPFGVSVDSFGNLYIVDSLESRVRMGANGIISTLAGDGNLGFSGDGGPATAAQLAYPMGVAADVRGDIYIADSTVRRTAD
jgi:hypothetical protein